jgi:hypothetical protein
MASEQSRFLLIMYPCTASNLLLNFFALEIHPNFHITPEGSGSQGGNGYFFIRDQMLIGKMGTDGKNMGE